MAWCGVGFGGGFEEGQESEGVDRAHGWVSGWWEKGGAGSGRRAGWGCVNRCVFVREKFKCEWGGGSGDLGLVWGGIEIGMKWAGRVGRSAAFIFHKLNVAHGERGGGVGQRQKGELPGVCWTPPPLDPYSCC